MQRTKSDVLVLGLYLFVTTLIGCGGAGGSTPPPPGSGSTGSVGGGGNKAGTLGGSAGASNGEGGGFQLGTGGSTSAVDCSGPNPPVSCTMKAPPGCGDGIVQTDLGEQCDDGNTLAGDGCRALRS
jgi:cysteine-rich repeat protein